MELFFYVFNTSVMLAGLLFMNHAWRLQKEARDYAQTARLLHSELERRLRNQKVAQGMSNPVQGA